MAEIEEKHKGIIFVDAKRCLGCKRCWQACAISHSKSKSFFDLVRLGEETTTAVAFKPIGKLVVPVECRHCEAPQCVIACPSGALKRMENGIVLLDSRYCVGCKSCMIACPYGAIRISNVTRKIFKCDFCIDRQAEGKGPACASACPTGCLEFVRIEEINERFKSGTLESLMIFQNLS